MLKLSNRLCVVSSMVRQGARVADVGCDHGYVPVYLVYNNAVTSAIASDINEKPLSSCKALVQEYGFEDRIRCVLSNGLENIKADELDDIIIAGMGGELIADILSCCPYVRDKHLILNPMTHPEIARKWLYDNGFEIVNDVVVEDSSHYYSVLDAFYKGDFSKKSRVDYFLGNISDFSQKPYFLHLLNYLKNKEKGGEDYSDVISAINAIL